MKKSPTVIACFLLGLLATSTSIADPGRYFLTTKADNSLCLESNAPLAGNSVGGAAFMTGCGNFSGMIYELTPKSAGIYSISSLGGAALGRCLESNKPGFNQEVLSATFNDDCGPFSGQGWTFTRIGINEYTVTSFFASPEGRCLEGVMDEIENGNPATGAAGMDICDGSNDQIWQLLTTSSSPASADTDADGITDTEELANNTDPLNASDPGFINHAWFVNPASNTNQVSSLRLINLNSEGPARVVLSAIDDAGTNAPGGSVTLDVPALATIEISSTDLEDGNSGLGLSGQFGDGEGKWRVTIASNRPVFVLSLLQTPDGKITNAMSTVPVIDGVHQILLGNGEANLFQESFLRFVNLADASGTVTLRGYTESGLPSDTTAVLSLGPRQSQQLRVTELESGNEAKGLSGSIGVGTGSWRIEATPSESVSLKVMNMMRTSDGFLTDLGVSVSIQDSAIAGTWRGTYTCNQGLTNLVLDINATNPTSVTAVFGFSENPANTGVPTGSFAMAGTYNPATKVLDLNATEWINRPGTYNTVDLTGSLSSLGDRLSGSIDTSGCTTFSLTKD